MTRLESYSVLVPGEKLEFATCLGDSLETVLAVQSIQHDFCCVGIVGSIPRFRAAITQSNELPSELQVFGSDVKAIWTLLQTIEGWDCVNVVSEVATSLGLVIQNQPSVRIAQKHGFTKISQRQYVILE